MERKVSFPCGELKLEGVLSLPDGAGPFPGVVVCHPHPLYGGSMDNNVVYAICRELAQRSIATLRFNFRGMGNSEGHHGGGVQERDDVTAALDFLATAKGIDPERRGLSGYSFGAGVCLFVAASPRVRALGLVSPLPIQAGFEQLRSFTQPKLFICGTSDMYASPDDVGPLVEALPEPKALEAVVGADHFWWGYEREISSKIGPFFAEALKG